MTSTAEQQDQATSAAEQQLRATSTAEHSHRATSTDERRLRGDDSGGVVSSSDVEKPSLQVEPGDYVYIRVFKHKHWKEPRREGPFKVVLATPTAVKVE
ncbi:hypothetical protein QTP70_017105, partial [Hemibagrus guttatus]